MMYEFWLMVLQIRWCALQHLSAYEIGLFPFFGMLADVIGEKEALEHNKHDEELDEDDGPEGTPQGHAPEALIIEIVNPIKETILIHLCKRDETMSIFFAKLEKKMDFASFLIKKI